ncbi:MAG: tRNA dimethylallyltransferase [Candidatus Curtissbacteria bacterium GW2011_GWC1_44_33]|uniref:tRNA dimethylallyltransferase n=1 Tax=Candidatus Curtissbacteria bacterium GW2011_GWC1_44_33 TaxID=1618413 RepID=A0A0G1J3M4_9BACT|nr:MAG: tRNA dimethylallyltransferase [Candidatus Curtissbacteria bacterium GW2011_GWC1_44_33]
MGGTGLYIKAIVDGIPTAKIPQSPALRENLAAKSQDELFEILAQLDPIKAGSLNSSDKKNPRRLIRAIEIATWNLEGKSKEFKERIQKFDPLFIGLTSSREYLFERNFEGKKTKKETIEDWKRQEKKYAKRQITWFKRDRRIAWFDITKPNWADSVEKLAKIWYSSNDAKKN